MSHDIWSIVKVTHLNWGSWSDLVWRRQSRSLRPLGSAVGWCPPPETAECWCLPADAAPDEGAADSSWPSRATEQFSLCPDVEETRSSDMENRGVTRVSFLMPVVSPWSQCLLWCPSAPSEAKTSVREKPDGSSPVWTRLSFCFSHEDECFWRCSQ